MSIIDHILKEKASSVYFELSRMLDEKASEIAAQYKSEFDRECFADINESSLVGNQHKLDANKNGKLDGHDFKLLRAKDDKPPFDEPYSKTKVHKDEYGNVIRNVAKRLAKKAMNAQKMKEDADQIDELSRDTLVNYIGKASYTRDHKKLPTKKVDNRLKGIAIASKKFTSSFAKEEADQIDELSKNTLVSYLTKASDQFDRAGEGKLTPQEAAKNRLAKKKIGDRRIPGMERAVGKLATAESVAEESEDLQELSKAKIADYLDKSQSGRQHPTPEKFRKSAKMATIAAKKIGKRFPGSGQVSVKVKATNEEAVNEISKDTADRYSKSAMGHLQYASTNRGDDRWFDREGHKLRNSDGSIKFTKRSDTAMKKDDKTIQKRLSGLQKAQKILTKEEASLQELSKDLLNRYMKKNYQDRKRLATGLYYPQGEEKATEKQKKDSAKLDKKVASGYLAHKKAYPKTWAKDNPPHLRFSGDNPARVHATEETVNENYERLQQLKRQMSRLQKQHDSIQGIHPDKKRIATKLSSLEKEHNALFRSQVKEETVNEDGASAVLRASVARSKLRDMEGKNKSPKLISMLKARVKAAEPYYDKPVKEETEEARNIRRGAFRIKLAKAISKGQGNKFLDDKNLTGKQHKIDKNKNGKIDAHDFKLLRKDDQ